MGNSCDLREVGKSNFFTVFISSRVVIDLLRDVIVDQSNRVPVQR